MKRSKFTEDQIAYALKQNELATSVDEVCRKMGISRERVFFIRPQALEAFSKNALTYDECASGRIVYAYVGGNPVSNVDPNGKMGLPGALMVLGGVAWSTYQGYQAGLVEGRQECEKPIGRLGGSGDAVSSRSASNTCLSWLRVLRLKVSWLIASPSSVPTHRAAYVAGNPLSNVDPEGLQGATTVDSWCMQNPVACAEVNGPNSAPIPRTVPRDIWLPDRTSGQWSCKARADCNDNIPGNVQRTLRSAFHLVAATRTTWPRHKISPKQTRRRTFNASPNTFRANARALEASSIREDVDMTDDIQVGDRVKLLGLPDWLTHDLPESEQIEMRTFVGQSAVVSEIDAHGYFWLGFGIATEVSDAARYSGHSFGVPREFIERDA